MSRVALLVTFSLRVVSMLSAKSLIPSSPSAQDASEPETVGSHAVFFPSGEATRAHSFARDRVPMRSLSNWASSTDQLPVLRKELRGVGREGRTHILAFDEGPRLFGRQMVLCTQLMDVALALDLAMLAGHSQRL